MEIKREGKVESPTKIAKITLILGFFACILLGIIGIRRGIHSLISGQVEDNLNLFAMVFDLGFGVACLYIGCCLFQGFSSTPDTTSKQ